MIKPQYTLDCILNTLKEGNKTVEEFLEHGGTYALAVSGTPENVASVTDIDVKGAKEITIYCVNGLMDETDTIISNGDSLDVDVQVFGSVGDGYTVVPIGSCNLGANSSDMIFLNTGIYKIKIIFTNNDAVNATNITYKIVVKI